MSVWPVGTSPFVSLKSVGVVYFGVPSSLNAEIGKMNGPAPLALSGKPASAVAVVDTFQVAIPSAPRNELRWADPMSTVTSTPLLVSNATLTAVDAEPFVKPLVVATVWARVVAWVVLLLSR